MSVTKVKNEFVFKSETLTVKNTSFDGLLSAVSGKLKNASSLVKQEMTQAFDEAARKYKIGIGE